MQVVIFGSMMKSVRDLLWFTCYLLLLMNEEITILLFPPSHFTDQFLCYVITSLPSVTFQLLYFTCDEEEVVIIFLGIR